MDYRFAYLFGTILMGLPAWALIFAKKKDARLKMFLVSLLGGLAAVITEFVFIQDYWRPETLFGWVVSIEDFLFGFLSAGVAAGIYEFVFGERLVGRQRHFLTKWPMAVLPVGIVGACIFYFLIFGLRMNSMYACFSALLVIFAWIVFHRHDLLIDAIGSGVFMGVWMIFGYLVLLWFYPQIFTRWWFLGNLSGLFLGPIPIEEILWAFWAGMVLGPLYEFVMGFKLRKG